MTLEEELKRYQPWNEQEERDREELLRRLRAARVCTPGTTPPGT